MKPSVHAQIHAHTWGGTFEEYLDLNERFDQSKMIFASMTHRMMYHSDWGIDFVTKLFGEKFVVQSTGTVLDTKTLCEAHVVEDVGFVPSVEEWLKYFDAPSYKVRYGKSLEHLNEGPVAIAAKYGGSPQDYQAIWNFFQSVDTYAPNNPKAKWLLHNAAGIFMAAELLGRTFRNASGRLISTRSIGEDIVIARMGHIPSGSYVMSRTQLVDWMRGSRVAKALAARKLKEAGIDACSADAECDLSEPSMEPA